MEKVNIPVAITRDERSAIYQAYNEGVVAASEESLDYIVRKLPRLLNRLRNSTETWMIEIANLAGVLNKCLMDDLEAPNKVRKEIIAALYYLCYPFEVIPDHVPGRGYADDALILNICLDRLRKHGYQLPKENLLDGEI